MEQSKPWGVGLLSVAAALALLYAFRAVLWPLALALVLAILIGVVTRQVQKLLPRAGRRTISIVTALFVGGLVLGAMLVVAAGVSQVLSQAGAIYRRLDEALGSVILPVGGRLTLDR